MKWRKVEVEGTAESTSLLCTLCLFLLSLPHPSLPLLANLHLNHCKSRSISLLVLRDAS